MRPNFRETLWFKKGDQDVVDSLPIEDRYDDAAEPIDASDSHAFGVHTGHTGRVPVLATASHADDATDAGHLVRDLKRGRAKVFAALGAGALMVAAVAAFVA